MKTGGVAKSRRDVKKIESYLAVSFGDLASLLSLRLFPF